ncbi:hypothetical protein LCGC14_2854770 [marine sediment metagenome]|uniref:Uncharacterized protein n=1 Tax=marine sediment metagenome TaxID=412755 RepID=A0A0F9AFM8_9ZZZZ
MNIDLDYDTDLNNDAEGFGIGLEELPPPENETITAIAHPPMLGTVANPLPGSSELGLNEAIALAQEACKWECTFYAWCDEYLHGVRQEALQDTSLVRYALARLRNYWGPAFFNTGTPKAHARYHAIMAAQAALSAVERRNKLPLIQKVIYYTGVIERDGGNI